MDPEEPRAVKKRAPRLWADWGVSAVAAVLVYFTAAFGSAYFGNNRLAADLYPGNLEAEIALMEQAKTPREAELRADAILRQNAMCVPAWDKKALVAAVDRNYGSMVRDKEQAIAIARYSIPEYEDYIFLLRRAIAFYREEGDEKSWDKYVSIALKVPEKLKAVRNQTSPLAYRIKDRPSFELTEQTQKYLQELEDQKNEKSDFNVSFSFSFTGNLRGVPPRRGLRVGGGTTTHSAAGCAAVSGRENVPPHGGRQRTGLFKV